MTTTSEAGNSRWFLVPIVLLGGLLTMLGVFFVIATGDDGFAVEPDYYAKASEWDEAVQARARSARLGWSSQADLEASADGTRLSVVLVDQSGNPVAGSRVEVEAFPNARAASVENLLLTEVADGRYEATLRSSRPGLWEVRIRATGAFGERYLETKRLDRKGRSP